MRKICTSQDKIPKPASGNIRYLRGAFTQHNLIRIEKLNELRESEANGVLSSHIQVASTIFKQL